MFVFCRSRRRGARRARRERRQRQPRLEEVPRLPAGVADPRDGTIFRHEHKFKYHRPRWENRNAALPSEESRQPNGTQRAFYY